MKQVSFKLPRIFPLAIANSEHHYKGHIIRARHFADSCDNQYFIYKTISVFGLFYVSLPTFVWTNSIENAMRYIDMKVS